MASKQRPRRLSVMGSDGREYVFLLKGHEDLRQDERVMQLFGLVNTLLTVDASCARLDLGIQRYSVVPLSTNSGLIEWVPQCDTLHALVRDYRTRRNILINVEHRLMLHYAPDLDSLSLMQKVSLTLTLTLTLTPTLTLTLTPTLTPTPTLTLTLTPTLILTLTLTRWRCSSTRWRTPRGWTSTVCCGPRRRPPRLGSSADPTSLARSPSCPWCASCSTHSLGGTQ